jgi:glycosyltransferase involved in cell wall biosynthesis
MIPLFNILNQKYDFELQIIGAKKESLTNGFIKYIPWKEETEVELISIFDIGIMPLENNLWEMGKCAYKIIQYMGCGIPVVASDVGMNKEVIENGENGFLVTTEKEWMDTLGKLIENQVLRIIMGQNGKKIVANYYSNQVNYKKMVSILRNGN